MHRAVEAEGGHAAKPAMVVALGAGLFATKCLPWGRGPEGVLSLVLHFVALAAMVIFPFFVSVVFDGAGDKGLSAGERSRVTGRELTIRRTEVAVAGKDLSTIRLDGVDIRDSRVGLTAYRKKPEFGPAEITKTAWSCSIVVVTLPTPAPSR